MSTVTYINTFHDPMDDKLGPSVFEVVAEPVEYNGFLIYRRQPDAYDVVKEGLCLGIYAGLKGAIKSIDSGTRYNRHHTKLGASHD